MLKSCTSGLMGALHSIRVRTAWAMFQNSNADFGHRTIRNYFGTSHAKGPQDGTGANLKHKADMEITKRNVIIQNAKDLYKFAENNLKTPAPSRYQSENVQLKRQILFYKVDRGRYLKEVKGNQAIQCSFHKQFM